MSLLGSRRSQLDAYAGGHHLGQRQTCERLVGSTIPEAIPLHHYLEAWANAVHLHWNGATLSMIALRNGESCTRGVVS